MCCIYDVIKSNGGIGTFRLYLNYLELYFGEVSLPTLGKKKWLRIDTHNVDQSEIHMMERHIETIFYY